MKTRVCEFGRRAQTTVTIQEENILAVGAPCVGRKPAAGGGFGREAWRKNHSRRPSEPGSRLVIAAGNFWSS
jgi:hypothetical protein